MAIVSDEQVIKVLRQYNPWWRNPLAIKEENKPQKRLAYYEALRMISHKTIRRFAVLSGARRVGKTTIMYQMMNSLIDEGVKPQKYLVCILRQSDCKARQCGDSPFYLRIPLSNRGNKVYLPR